MKKIFYLIAAVIFISSCSTSQFTKDSKSNSDRMAYAHKDVVKHEVAKVETPTFVNNQEAKVNKQEAVKTNLDIKTEKKSVKNFVKKIKAAKEIKKAVKDLPATKVLGDYKVASFEQTALDQAYESAASQSSRMDPTVETLLLIALILFVPFGTIIAVGYVNNWDVMPMVYNALWLLLCGIPGLIHALIHVFRR